MSRKVLAGLAILSLGLYWYLQPQPGNRPSKKTVAVATNLPPVVVRKPPLPAAAKPAKVVAPISATPEPVAAPPAPDIATAGAKIIELHKELIPKDVSIVHCYYSQEIAAPGSAFGFDIDGSGFTAEFEKMIKVDPGEKDIRVKNLRLATANQIHGEIEVGPEAATSYVYPTVLIKDLAVFVAPQPFAVVRRGEVLSVKLTEMAEDGQSSKFRVVTNIDEKMFRQFWVEPSKPGLKVSSLKPTLPFIVDGVLRITGAATGEYGLTVSIFSKEVYRESVDVLTPNLGKSGLISEIAAADRYHRPGDSLELLVNGTGFSPEDAAQLAGRVRDYDMGAAKFAYVSPKQIRAFFAIPISAAEGPYGVTITGPEGKVLIENQNVFTVVAPLWLRGVSVDGPLVSGGRGVLKVTGRDLTPEFAKDLQIEVDEPGIAVTALRRVDSFTLAADITIDSAVAPGDYLLYLRAQGKLLKPRHGSIIKVLSR